MMLPDRIIKTGFLFYAIAILPSFSLQAQPVTTGSLVRQMANLEHLAEYPEPFYHTIQYSSYDRRSNLPDGEGWYANSDGFGGEPIPNFEAVLEEPGQEGTGTYLICDVEGPGAIVRGWTAQIGGTVRAYLDGKETAFFEGSANTFFRNPYAPFLEEVRVDSSVFEGTFRQRDAGYFPIPFAGHLRVEWTGNLEELHFYELQIRKYEKGTKVETFKPGDITDYRSEILKTGQVLRNPENTIPASAQKEEKKIAAELSEGTTEEVLALQGEGAVYRLALKVEADNIEKALRQTVLNIRFDGSPRGQVEAPVGDFFGAAPGINPFVSLPFTVKAGGMMICRFVMPFKESIKINIENRGDQKVKIIGSVSRKDYDWDPERSMHFQAHWRVDHKMNPSFPYDLPFVAASGQGVYVGTSSLLFNPIEIPTPGGNWWGEGDEKIFVDDRFFPAIFGTGSEDYYNYSWSSPDIFQFSYAGQPRNDGPGNRGFVTNHRWHILDPIPFKEQLQFFMELFSHTQGGGFSYARLSYLYARPGLKDDHLPLSDEDLRFVEHHNWSPVAKGGASNSIFYQTENMAVKNKHTGTLKGNLWAEGKLFVWYPEKEGEELNIPFKVDGQGNYKIWMTAAKLSHSGKISARIDGQEAGLDDSDGLIDLFSPHRKLLRNYGSDTIELDEGGHTLNIRFEKQGPSSGKKNRVGIDFIWVQRQ